MTPRIYALRPPGPPAAVQNRSRRFYRTHAFVSSSPRMIVNKAGGEGGIRTHEGLPLAGFQDQCLQPLGHLSGCARIPKMSVSR